MNAPHPEQAWYEERLAHPHTRGQRRARIVIDTDAANEIDDAFAVAWALRCPRELEVAGLYATPFSFAHRREDWMRRFGADADAAPFDPPAIGMQRSLDTLHALLGELGPDEPRPPVLAGCTGYLPGPREALRSAAVEHLIASAREHDPQGEPLYVVALGCATNVASALLLAPDIARRIVVVWTSGYPSHAPWVNHSFNLEQDLHASRWLLDSGVPHVYLPGYHVGAQLRLSQAEVQRHLPPEDGAGIGAWLHRLFHANPLWPALGRESIAPGEVYSWTLWDVINIAWLLQADWVPSGLVTTPGLEDDFRWRAAAGRHPMREAWGVERDAVFGGMFEVLR